MSRMLFDKRNYIFLATAVILIIIGFILMSGGKSSDGVSFNPEIFSARRIVVAPIICLAGFILFCVGIMLPRKKESRDEEKTTTP